jgi:hypothetical protein
MKLIKLLILFLFLSFKGFSQTAPSYTLKYDKTEFCAGLNEFSNPIITNSKGEIINEYIIKKLKFNYIKLAGEGVLELTTDGKINLSKSDIGSYQIFFFFIFNKVSFNIIVKDCK